MKYPRITTANRPGPLPPFTTCDALDLGNGIYCRVVITRGAADPRNVVDQQANAENLVTVTKKAVQIDIDGNIISQPNGLASATRTTTENVDLTGIGDSYSWRPAWVRVPVPTGENWNANNLPPDCTVVAALPASGVSGARVYLDPTVYEWSDGLVAAMSDCKGDELLRIVVNSAQLAGVEF